MGGKRSRDKGKRGEREVVALFHAHGFDGAKRATQSRDGADYPDVDGTAWWVECKRQKAPSIHAAMSQASAATTKAGDARAPVVFTRRDGEEWLVTMKAADWLEIASILAAKVYA